jgi:limonene-1,2-epoxide hydrolase
MEAQMKILLSRITIPLLILTLVITGCSGQNVQVMPDPTTTVMPSPEPTSQTPSEVVQDMVARMNNGDIEGSLEYFADDAMVYIVGLPPTGMEVYAGKEQIRALWQDSVANHFQWETEITSVEGNIVLVKAKTWHDFTRQLEVAPLEYYDVYEVKDGKITTYGTTITADALARFKPALAEVMPVEEPAAPSTEQPVSEMTVTIAGGTCTYKGSMTLNAGQINITVNVDDQNKDAYGITFFTLDSGKDLLDLMASTVQPSPPSWSNMFSIEEVEPGTSKSYNVTTKEGPIYLICWSKPPDLPIGNAGPIEVKQ